MVAGGTSPRRAWAAGLLAMILLAVLGHGCGQRLDLPEQPEIVFVTPEPGTYNYWTTWALPSPSDLDVIGLELFVIEQRQRVGVYSSRRNAPTPSELAGEFDGLLAPVRLAAVKRDSTFVVVADSGDMRIKIYYWLGGEPLHSFTDSIWRRFSGLVADGDLNIYVADAQRDTIQVYDRWGRRRHVVSDFGTGSGYVIDPHGLAHNGQVLIAADTGKNWVQRLDPDTSNIAVYLDPIGLEEDLLLAPLDVATDPLGEYVYVADSGHNRVLKFQIDGAFADTVYSPGKIPLVAPILSNPRYLCARDSLVYVADPREDRIVILQLSPE